MNTSVNQSMHKSILGYCTNVHPGATWEKAWQQLSLYPKAVRSQYTQTPDPLPFGIGIWLSAQAASQVLHSDGIDLLEQLQEDIDGPIYSFNGFPYSDFHSDQVKKKVFFPDWSEPARLEFTLQLAKIAEQLCKRQKFQNSFSISTVPLGDQSIGPRVFQATHHLIAAALELFRIERKSSAKIHLDLEPEPSCYLETSLDLALYFKNYLIPVGVPVLKKEFQLSNTQAQEVLLDKIRICYDICHSAVMFEDFEEVLKNLNSQGILFGKIQISSAIELLQHEGVFASTCGSQEQISESLKNLSHDRYLHQVVGFEDEKKVTFEDLPQALVYWKKQKPSKVSKTRVHYHVPIFLKEFEGLSTTQNQILRVIQHFFKNPLSHSLQPECAWEIETYTWFSQEKSSSPELQTELQSNLATRIATEFNWFSNQWKNLK